MPVFQSLKPGAAVCLETAELPWFYIMVCHMDAQAMYEIGAISDKEMREYDRACLVKEPGAIYASEEPPKTEYAATLQ